LCRVEILKIVAKSRQRGEYFAKWQNPTTGEKYDGTSYFAHYCVMEYAASHTPAMTVRTRADGSFKAPSNIFKQIRRYIRI
jgi:hypothetical protein